MEFCQGNALVIANTVSSIHKRQLYTWTSPSYRGGKQNPEKLSHLSKVAQQNLDSNPSGLVPEPSPLTTKIQPFNCLAWWGLPIVSLSLHL